MKKEQFSDLMNYIDDRLIADAKPLSQPVSEPTGGRKGLFPARSRVWKIASVCICVCIVVALIVPAMKKKEPEVAQPENTTAPDSTVSSNQPNTPDVIQYIVYCSSGEGILRPQANHQESTVAIKGIGQKNFNPMLGSGSIKLSDKAVSQTIQIGKKSYVMQYSFSTNTAFITHSNTALQALGSYDDYDFDDDTHNISVSINPTNNALLFYIDYNGSVVKGGDLTEEQAKQLAAQDITDIYGDAATKYSFDKVIVEENKISVIYGKQIAGYNTIDRIHMTYNKQGQLSSINARNFGLLDSFADLISNEQIQAAESVLLELIPANTTIHKKMLVMDSEGDVHLNFYGYCRQDDGQSTVCDFYINVT